VAPGRRVVLPARAAAHRGATSSDDTRGCS
jgi:hypothetical protein